MPYAGGRAILDYRKLENFHVYKFRICNFCVQIFSDTSGPSESFVDVNVRCQKNFVFLIFGYHRPSENICTSQISRFTIASEHVQRGILGQVWLVNGQA